MKPNLPYHTRQPKSLLSLEAVAEEVEVVGIVETVANEVEAAAIEEAHKVVHKPTARVRSNTRAPGTLISRPGMCLVSAPCIINTGNLHFSVTPPQPVRGKTYLFQENEPGASPKNHPKLTRLFMTYFTTKIHIRKYSLLRQMK